MSPESSSAGDASGPSGPPPPAFERLLAEHYPDYVALVDRELRFVWVNRLDPRLVPEEVYGRSFLDFTVAEAQPAARAAVERAFAERAPGSYEVETLVKGERGRWYHTRVVPLAERDDLVLLVTSDITALKEAAAGVARQRANLEELLEGVPGALLEVDAQGRVTWANAAAVELLGPQALGGRIEPLLGGDEAWADLRAQGRRRVELRRGRDGAPRQVEWTRAPLRAGAASLLLARDETERLEAQRLEREHRRLEAAVAQVSDAVLITDPEGRILFVNPGFQAVTGYAAGEAVGSTPGQLLGGGRTPARVYEEMWAALGAGRQFGCTLINRRRDGTAFEADVRITPIMDEGRVTSYVAVERDVTGQRQAQKLELLGELSAGIAHEINNPANFITLNASLLLELWTDLLPILDAHLGGDPQRTVARLPWAVLRAQLPQLLEGILVGGRRLGSITRDLTSFARPGLEATERVSLAALMHAVQTFARARLRARGAEVTVVGEEGVELEPLLPRDLEHVLLNLVLNAADFVPEGGGRIEVSLRRLPDALELRVSDDGPGVPPELRARVFEPFFTTRPGKGSGMGLAVSSRIVRDLGGTLACLEGPLPGACFALRLPLPTASD